MRRAGGWCHTPHILRDIKVNLVVAVKTFLVVEKFPELRKEFVRYWYFLRSYSVRYFAVLCWNRIFKYNYCEFCCEPCPVVWGARRQHKPRARTKSSGWNSGVSEENSRICKTLRHSAPLPLANQWQRIGGEGLRRHILQIREFSSDTTIQQYRDGGYFWWLLEATPTLHDDT